MNTAGVGSFRNSMARVLMVGLLLGGRGMSAPPTLPKFDEERVVFGEGRLHLRSKSLKRSQFSYMTLISPVLPQKSHLDFWGRCPKDRGGWINHSNFTLGS